MPAFVYDSTSVTRSFNFEKGAFHYLTVVLSNCLYNGAAFYDSVEDLETALETEFKKITNLEMRGVGCSMVVGSTDSLTLGMSAGYYSSKANLTEAEALALRAAINDAITAVSGLTVSEVRVETTLIQESTN